MLLALLALACSDDPRRAAPRTDDTDTGAADTGAPDDDSGRDTDSDSDTDSDTNTDTDPPSAGCRAATGDADVDRTVLVALPYDADGDSADRWAVLTLTADGDLVDDGTRITMGRATAGEVMFTPDGSLALAATERGALAVYDAANGRVVESAWDGGFYAERIVMDPTGEVAYVVDGNWPNNGGGLYRVALDCATGEPSDAERVIEAKNPADLVWDGEDAWFVGREIPGTAAGDDAALLSWPDAPAGRPSATDGVDAFGDDEAYVSSATIAGEWLLIADNNEFSGYPTRVARVELRTPPAIASVVEIEDPVALVPFPDGSARALVASGYGDSLYVLDAAAGRVSRVSARGVQLPGAMSSVRRGPLAGRVIVSEVEGVRSVQLGSGGATDLGVTALGSGLDSLPGAVGVAP